MRRFIALLFLSTLIATSMFAQSQATTGVIEGTVVDASGASLPGVTVTTKNIATNFEQTVVTDRNGRFRVVLLPLGPYEVTAMLEGFGRVIQKGLDLGVGQTLTVTITMKPATVSEQIVVTAAAPL